MIKVYTDGSYNQNKKKAGRSFIILENEKIIASDSGFIENSDQLWWQIVGELNAVIEAVFYAKKKGFKEITIFSDLELSKKLFYGIQRAHKFYTKNYISILKDAVKNGLNIKIEWVKGHSDNKYNNQADELANEAAFCLETSKKPMILNC